MRNVAPREAYERHMAPAWRRLRRRTGAAFGLVMGLFVALATMESGFVGAAVLGLLMGGLSGLVFGWLWTASMRWRMTRFNRRAYDGDPTIIGDAPGGCDFRLLCSLWWEDKRAVPGVLYLGREALHFVPHRRVQQTCQPLRLRGFLVVQVATMEQGFLSRMIVGTVLNMELSVEGDRYTFMVPEAEETVRNVERILSSYRVEARAT